MAFDALVIGAGVAGCATTLELLSAGWRVAILHRRDNVSAMESLSPAAVSDLNKLSIRNESAFSEIVAWWGSEQEARATQLGAGIVRRSALADSLRARAIDGGARVIEIKKVSYIERFSDGWELAYELTPGDQRKLRAGYLIDGTGRASVIGRHLGARRVVFDQLFCTSVSVNDPGLVGTWTESTADGWWNLCCVQKEGTLSFYSTAQRLRKSKRDITGCLYETRHMRHLVPAPMRGKCQIRPCGSSRLVPCAGPGWVSVGDAASTIQPLASGGVAKALRDARMARQALEYQAGNYDRTQDRKSTRLNSSHIQKSRMPSSA